MRQQSGHPCTGVDTLLDIAVPSQNLFMCKFRASSRCRMLLGCAGLTMKDLTLAQPSRGHDPLVVSSVPTMGYIASYVL